METWHKRLTFARDTAGKSKTDLAKAVGVSNATVSDWESGEIKTIEATNCLKACEFLCISITWLQFGKGEMFSMQLTDDDIRAVKINRSLDAKEKRAWYRAGNSLAEPDEGTNGKQ